MEQEISSSFFQRKTDIVARDLLGKKLIRLLHDEDGSIHLLSGIIIETEAYGYDDDEASHAYRGITERNRIMFDKPGIAYIYLIYGTHYCLNVSARDSDSRAGAVLLRSLLPDCGIEKMSILRNCKDFKKLTFGPGNLTKALSIGKSFNGKRFTKKNDIYFTNGIDIDKSQINEAPRIGIKKGIEKNWRFILNYSRLY